MLVVIVVWALTAVVLLTGTLITAQRIDNRVGVINSEVSPIDEDLDSVVLAVETGRIAGEINTAAKPLTAQFTQIIESGDGIEASAASIAERAKQINANAESINSTVGSINSNVSEIGVGADEIGASIGSINANARSINSSVDGISGSFVGIDGEVRSIHDEVRGINTRADTVIGISRGIKGNTEGILGLVPQINENAAAIAGSPLLLRSIALLNQQAAASSLPVPPAAPGIVDQLPLPDVVGALPLPDVVGALPLQDTVPPALPVLPLPTGGLLQSSGSDTGNLLGALR